MSSEIEIWGGRPRQGLVEIDAFSDDAKKDVPDTYRAYITKFPEFSYGTDWGSWDDSNSGWITKKLKTLAGGDDSIPGNIVKMLGGPYYKPPILTDKWTQLAAQLSDDAYVKFDMEMIAYPVIDTGKNGAHVEGLRYDNKNLYNILTFHGKKLNNMWDWLNLGKKALMPSTKFSTDMLLGNLGAIQKNLAGKNGNLIIGGAGAVGDAIAGVFTGNGSFGENASKGVAGIEDILKGLISVGARLGHTFLMKMYDNDGRVLFNSSAPQYPVDFYISGLEFEFSPHLLKIVNADGTKRMGACPEYCKIKMTIESVTMLSPSQINDMCKYNYK